MDNCRKSYMVAFFLLNASSLFRVFLPHRLLEAPPDCCFMLNCRPLWL